MIQDFWLLSLDQIWYMKINKGVKDEEGVGEMKEEKNVWKGGLKNEFIFEHALSDISF